MPSDHLPTILLFHPYNELYGSDRMVAVVAGAVRDRYRCVVVLPEDGALAELVRAAGAEVLLASFPIVRKALLRPAALLRFVLQLPGALIRTALLVRRTRPEICYVNTIAIPVVLFACWLSRRPTVCHVHEAERAAGRTLEYALTAPLLCAGRVIAISDAAKQFVGRRIPLLRSRTVVVHNGLDIPGDCRPLPNELPSPLRMLLVGRWSERKGTDLGISALKQILDTGVPATLDVVGGVFPGYEWYEEKIRRMAQELGIEESVRFLPFVPDPSSLYDQSHVVIVPSRIEPFGLVAVEGFFRGRIVIASDVEGLSEVMSAAPSSWSFESESVAALAKAVVTCAEDWPTSAGDAETARRAAHLRFSTARFQAELLDVIESQLRSPG